MRYSLRFTRPGRTALAPGNATPDAFIGSILRDGEPARLDLTGLPVTLGTDEIGGIAYGLMRLGSGREGQEVLGVTAEYCAKAIGVLMQLQESLGEPVPAELGAPS